MNYSQIRGFNYQPSYASHGLEAWGHDFDVSIFKKEISLGKKYFPGMNTIRLWLSHDSYIRHGQAMADRFHRVIDLADELDIRFIPTLFNGWHSLPDFGGVNVQMLRYWGDTARFDLVFTPYLEMITKPHAEDDRILLWDLCNEPFVEVESSDATTVIFPWLKRVYQQCKAYGVKAPLSVGSVPVMSSLHLLEPISDVITFHPYFAWNAWVKTPKVLEAFLDEAIAFGKTVQKPMLATETGWGALDDKKRSEILTVELEALTQRKLGFTAHLLHHTLVADGHRPAFGPISDAGYMAFIEKNGSLRAFHDIFNRF